MTSFIANLSHTGRVIPFMDTNLLDIKFSRHRAFSSRRSQIIRLVEAARSGVISLDVQSDRRGEFFEIVRPGGGRGRGVAVLDVQPAGIAICSSW